MGRKPLKPSRTTVFLLCIPVLILFAGFPAFAVQDPSGPTVLAEDERDYWPKINRISPPPPVPSDRQLLIESRLGNLQKGGHARHSRTGEAVKNDIARVCPATFINISIDMGLLAISCREIQMSLGTGLGRTWDLVPW